MDSALKPMIIEQFDKLVEELKKGDQKNMGLVAALWSMVSGAVKTVPGVAAVIEALDNLKEKIGT